MINGNIALAPKIDWNGRYPRARNAGMGTGPSSQDSKEAPRDRACATRLKAWAKANSVVVTDDSSSAAQILKVVRINTPRRVTS